MEILKALGVDSTLWIQLGCFVVSYLALTNLVFKPYLKAFQERERRTVGNEDSAVRTIQEAQDLEGEYEKKARDINSQIKAAYDESRSLALKEYESAVRSAREVAAKDLEAAREKITEGIATTRKKLSAEIPEVSVAIASKLAGKDLSV